MNRIAPNNQLPATHYVEVYDFKEYDYCEYSENPLPINNLNVSLRLTSALFGETIAIFRIRENKLSTKHKF
jgi:hypothetical protein